MSRSKYGGLDTSPTGDVQQSAAAGNEEGWLHIPGVIKRRLALEPNNIMDDKETQSLASSKIQSMFAP